MKKLSEIPTTAPKQYDKEQTKAKTKKLLERLAELQAVMYAEGKYSVLVVVQGMDASGKDGAIRSVFSGLNPLACSAKPWKVPTEEEFAHDFLWRIHKEVPAKGTFKLFNRSHYEDILVPTVHGTMPLAEVEKRYDHINDFEKLLTENGTLVFKFYLHISAEEQQARFKERLTDPTKLWKYKAKDQEVANRWDSYMEVYEKIFKKCDEGEGWTIVPSDQNWYKVYTIAKTIVERLEKLNMKYPM